MHFAQESHQENEDCIKVLFHMSTLRSGDWLGKSHLFNSVFRIKMEFRTLSLTNEGMELII